MKTNLVLFRTVSLCLLSFSALGVAVPLSPNASHLPVIAEVPAMPARPGYYLVVKACPDADMTYCCCADGNSRVCPLPANMILCITGGPFECLDEYKDCIGNSGDCSACCNPCRT